MELQWPLIVFTFFVCLSSGTLAGMGVLALKNKGSKIFVPSLVTAAVALVIGGLGSFTHLQHWERIFNGFGHITSGITQELIGCVILGIIIIAWIVVLRKGTESVPKGMAWASIIGAVIMVLATGHSYFMPSRPAWGIGLIIFYLCNAALLGAATMWVIASIKGDEELKASGVKMTFFGAIAQLAANVIYLLTSALSGFAQYGYHADPTAMTTPIKGVSNLASTMLAGDGALTFWFSIVFGLVALLSAMMAKKKVKASKGLPYLALIAAVIASITFRVLFYQIGYSVFLLY